MKKYYSVTNVLIAINVLVMLVMVSVNYINHDTYKLQNDTLINFGGVVPHESSLLTMFSFMFLHASIWHILGNMFTLKMLGDMAEKQFGKSYLPLYIVSGLVSGLTVYLFSNNPTVGASGAICGLLGAQVIHAFKYDKTKRAKVGSTLDVIILIGIGFLPNISALGHAGGLVAGLVFALVYFHIYDEKMMKAMLENEKNKKALLDQARNNTIESKDNESFESQIIITK